MSISNFSGGFKDGVTIKGVPLTLTNPGAVFFVGNGDVLLDRNQSVAGVDHAGGGTFQRPFRTVDFAIGQCTASRGDVIFVMPGHTETVSATSIALDVAGVAVIHLGAKENQAVYTFNATGSTVTVTGANCSWIGGIHQSTILDCASAFTTGAAKGFTLLNGMYEDTSSILNFLSIVTTGATDNDADDLTVMGNTWTGLNTSPLAFVSILAAQLRPIVTQNKAYLAATSGGEFITLAAKIVTGAEFSSNDHIVVGATGTTTGIFLTGSGSTSTGIVKNNNVASLDTTTELIATAGTGLVYFENYYTGVADKSGKLWPVVDAA